MNRTLQKTPLLILISCLATGSTFANDNPSEFSFPPGVSRASIDEFARLHQESMEQIDGSVNATAIPLDEKLLVFYLQQPNLVELSESDANVLADESTKFLSQVEEVGRHRNETVCASIVGLEARDVDLDAIRSASNFVIDEQTRLATESYSSLLNRLTAEGQQKVSNFVGEELPKVMQTIRATSSPAIPERLRETAVFVMKSSCSGDKG